MILRCGIMLALSTGLTYWPARAEPLARITPQEAYAEITRSGELRRLQIDGDLDVAKMQPPAAAKRIVLQQVQLEGTMRSSAGGPAVALWITDTSRLRDIDLRGTRWSAPLMIESSAVTDRARFDEVQFDAQFVLHATTLTGQVQFHRARFMGPVEITSSTFRPAPPLRASVNFSDTRFMAPARFDRSDFATGVRFDSARFEADASFLGLKVAGRASWRNVIFNADAEFRFCRLGNADFGDAEQMSVFMRLADFRGCAMETLRLDYADARGDMLLVNMQVAPGDLSFRQASLRGARNDFSGLKVAGKLDLTGSQIANLQMRWPEITELPNGLTIVGETNPAARSVAVGFWVKTGARDETLDVNGVTHFLEHMIFKGTERRDAIQVNRDFDAIGSNPNAFTSEENTVFHATVLPEYLSEAVEILGDILRPSLRVEDFHLEKKVILEEIGMYYDQPSYSAYETAKQAFFGSHPLGHSVLGTPESITALTRDQMYEYFRVRYVAPNITVVAAGNFDWPKLVGDVKKKCASWETGPAPRVTPPTRGEDAFKVVPKDKIIQEHAFLIAAGPPGQSDQRYAAEVLSTIVGDDTGSRLYWALEDPGILDAAHLEYHEYDGTGAFYAYLSGDADNFQEGLGIAFATLREVQKKGVTAEELHQAKSKIGSRMVRGSERPMGRMPALGYYWTYLKKYRSVDEELRALDAVDLAAIRTLLDQYPLDRVATVALGPLQTLDRP